MPDIGERKLATIRRVSKIEPIPGADVIVKATIDGWELVTQKGNYVENDLCVYFEIDAFLPVREEFEFLRKGCFKSTTNLGDGFRIKTIKLRGQVSQGLSLPMKDFFQKDDHGWYYVLTDDNGASGNIYLEEGADVTEYFKVQKYEKPLSAAVAGTARGNFPSFIPKTDQERAQNCLAGIKRWIHFGEPIVVEVTQPSLIEALDAGKVENVADSVYFKSGDLWFHKYWMRNDEATVGERSSFEATLKLDGSSMTVYHKDGRVGVCSRNLELKRDPESAFWKALDHSGLLAFLSETGIEAAVQGELMGPGVQGNRESFSGHGFFIFDVYDGRLERYLTPKERAEFIARYTAFCLEHAFLGVCQVSVLNYRFTITEETTIESLLEYANRKSIRHDVAEGVVFKSHVPGGPSFKIINNVFLLKEKD